MIELLSLIGFLANLVFFVWFGTTLNSINRNLAFLALRAQDQDAQPQTGVFTQAHADRLAKALGS